MPIAAPTITAISVGRPAAASCTSRPGRRNGRWANAHPASTAATAPAPATRAGS
jgi:hypothetical protein